MIGRDRSCSTTIRCESNKWDSVYLNQETEISARFAAGSLCAATEACWRVGVLACWRVGLFVWSTDRLPWEGAGPVAMAVLCRCGGRAVTLL